MFDLDSMSEKSGGNMSGNKFFHRGGIQSVMIQSAAEKQNQEQQELQALLAKYQFDPNQQPNEDAEPFVLEDDDLPANNSNNGLTLPNSNSQGRSANHNANQSVIYKSQNPLK